MGETTAVPRVTVHDRESVAIDPGAALVIIAGLGLVAYGAIFLARNFSGFIELGLTPAHIGATPNEIRAFSPRLFNYISHLQVAIAGFIAALGVVVLSLAWNGMRRRMAWAAWTVLLATIVSVGIALPLHYVYGLATIGHLGTLYVDVAMLVVGSVYSIRASARTRSLPVSR